MGLDCIPLGRAKPGFEDEWRAILQVLQSGNEDEDQVAGDRFEEISIPPYADLGAPIVGQDREADDFILALKPKEDLRSDAEYLEQHKGYHVIEMLEGSGGIPNYSNSSLGYVPATSFRGNFLRGCGDILDDATIAEAWTDVMSPEQAEQYGRKLLDAASQTRAVRLSQQKLLDDDVEKQIETVEAAGRWYVFWGERGNPIAAFY